MSEIPKLDRRAPAAKVTAVYEDGGLFKGGVVQASLDLVPVFGTSSRGDATVRGFVDKSKVVTVIFAGRRRPYFEALYTQLRFLFAQANYSAAMRRVTPPDVNSIRLRVQIEGAWRAHMQQLDNGQTERHMQFLAARWAYIDSKGKKLTFGIPPNLPKADATKASGEQTAKTEPFGFGTGWPGTNS